MPPFSRKTQILLEQLKNVILKTARKTSKHLRVKINGNLQSFARICNLMTLKKCTSLIKTFIKFQFDRCPLMLMFHNRQL